MGLYLGKHSYGSIKIIGRGCGIFVGKYCSIADNVKAITVGHDAKFLSTYPFNSKHMRNIWPEAKDIPGHPTTKGNILIGNDVWIGYGVTLMSGVFIGSGSIIAANSFVNKDIKPYSIVGGLPAKLINYRFTFKQIKELMDICWWDWQEEKIRENIHYFCSDKIDEFIEKFKIKGGKND